MKNKKISLYLYPMVPTSRMGSKNPYMENLETALAKHINIVNSRNYSRLGILTAFKYLRKADIFYFNWLENIPFFKLGFIQFAISVILLICIKVSGKKIIWTMHNKKNHHAKSKLFDYLFQYLVRNANLIIVHSQDSCEYLMIKGRHQGIFYSFHPFAGKQVPKDAPKVKPDFDILIWGTMNRYKGVYDFLTSVKGMLGDIRIKIVGKFTDLNYLNEVLSASNPNISVVDKFLSISEIEDLHQRSRYVLFPYRTGSVINSGALVDSLKLGSRIIGPQTGAFKDLADMKLIYTYEEYSDVVKIVKDSKETLELVQRLDDFLAHNTWEEFASRLYVKLEGILNVKKK